MNTLIRTLTLIVLCHWLWACKTTSDVQVAVSENLLDEAFSGYQTIPIETQEQVFSLDDAAKEYVYREFGQIHNTTDKVETMVRSIFDRSEFNLLYVGSANTTATDTFHNRAANCLSMSIMTYALAKEAGLHVQFRHIDIPEYWTRREGVSLLNSHVNLRIMPGADAKVKYLARYGMEVDFDPLSPKKQFPSFEIEKRRVLAMFYNNRGADALLKQDFLEAYAYFRAAIYTDPHFASTWINLGFLYRLQEHYDAAQRSYEQALALEPKNLTAWDNTAVLFQMTGREQEAEDIQRRVERQRLDNPYYHQMLAKHAIEQQDWNAAIRHYRRAISLDRTRHEFYFGLATTYYYSGDKEKSAEMMKRARRSAREGDLKLRYQGKLDALQASRLSF